jgi:hypothetical protein
VVRRVVVVFGATRVPQASRRHLPLLPREKTSQFSCTVSHCQVSEMRFALGVSGASEMTRHGGKTKQEKLLWLVADPFLF